MAAGSRWRVFRARADETLPARLALRWMLALLRRPEQLRGSGPMSEIGQTATQRHVRVTSALPR